jgi:DNA-binding NtrC family response regulator
MHIAVCDDNIADRKQTERLLSRESDRRKADTGVFYVRLFGHEEALLKSPMSPNLYIIDMVKSEFNGLELALKLCESGITAEILLLVSEIDYRKAYTKLSKPPMNIHFLDKPIKVNELTNLLDKAIEKQARINPKPEPPPEEELKEHLSILDKLTNALLARLR